MPDFITQLTDSEAIIHNGGLLLIFLIVFAENGLFFGFFLPGDYLLFSAGLLCGTGDFDVSILALTSALALGATAGSYTGYLSGRAVGKKFFKKKDTLFFKHAYLVRTRAFFMKYGGKTLVVGRFLPIVRTFGPIFAGIIEMDFGKFSFYNIFGGCLWVFSLVLGGYFLGQKYPEILNYLEYIILAFLLLTSFVVARSFFEMRLKRQKKEKARSAGPA